MKHFWSIAGYLACLWGAMFVLGCSESKDSAGIEIGNPSLASSDTVAVALALTADFSVDYADVEKAALAKEAAEDEAVLLDSFSMSLFEVRSYSSYYVGVSFDPTEGLLVWPYEESPEAALPISFTAGSSVEEPFEHINLKDEGYLKEIGVSFKPSATSSNIQGRILVDGKYVPFEYSLSAFQKLTLRYHFSQVEQVTDSLVNLSVVFQVRYFVDSLDLSQAEIGEDGIIRFSNSENVGLWNKLNARFIPSFRPLRYDYVDAQGNAVSDYVTDIWNEVVGTMSDNTITNGDFSKGMEDWILFTQLGGTAETSFKGRDDDRTLVVKVTNGGTKSYSVQLIQENVALVAGKKYKCVFTIWSDVEGQITARIGTYDDYETVGFQKHVDVKTGGHSVEVEFAPTESTPFARFELNLGKEVRTFYIKEIKIYRIEE